ncbi:hypothetical protein FRB99_003184, partial [Tulasnella sp. 403]
ELDSYMYQTVGQDAIEFVAAALELPLIRQVISGTAVEQGSEYGNRSTLGSVLGDETEDLFQLLSTTRFPDIEAVSVGAILSNYQRVRVEHVCRRLSLTPLCYLWQRDQAELMSEMVESGVEAVLIKVAGIGLTDKHLGLSLRQMQPTFLKLNSLYGSHICGEGGEYETLTLDCPIYKSKIVLVEVEPVVLSGASSDIVAYLRIKRVILERKDANVECFIPSMLDEPYSLIQAEITQISPTTPSAMLALSPPRWRKPISRRLGRWVGVCAVEPPSIEGSADNVEEEVITCFRILKDELSLYGLDLYHVSHINLSISAMELFARINTVYATMFGVSPPTRACVAVDLPPPLRIRLDCIAYAEAAPQDRRSLHVQSISYWAPANIGPYSQSISAANEIFISGQIGLIPASMQYPSPPSLATETALAFQHVDRIVSCVRTNSGKDWGGVPQCAILWTADAAYFPAVRAGWQCYTKGNDPKPLGLLVACKTIPKGGMVEVQMLTHTGMATVFDEDMGVNQDVKVGPSYDQRKSADLLSRLTTDTGEAVWWTVEVGEIRVGVLVARGDVGLQQIAKGALSNAISVRLFYAVELAENQSYLELEEQLECIPTSLVPCRAIGTMEADWNFALVVFSVQEKE